MATQHQKAMIEALRLVPATCPKVDDAFEDCLSLVKEQTNALRDALINTIEERMAAELQIAELEEYVIKLEAELDELRKD